MADIFICRAHTLAPQALTALTDRWVAEAQSVFGLVCQRTLEGDAEVIAFSRTGVYGQFSVTPTELRLQARLGFLLSAYQGRIEAELQRQLDLALAQASA